ncbi:MAG: hypothetical protein JSS00_05720 [Proteobacteria bacterium]|nr:hypothetical protein [Pseudomonadota bacterium]
MSLNKTLDRLFDEIRREAKRNPEFADRLDAVLRLHDSRRDVDGGVIEEVTREAEAAPAPAAAPAPKKKSGTPASSRQSPAPAGKMPAVQAQQPAPPLLNPVGIFKRAGEDGLSKALATQELPALRALVVEHNLDPSGETEALDRDALAAHVVAQAKRRAERDEKMFDY